MAVGEGKKKWFMSNKKVQKVCYLCHFTYDHFSLKRCGVTNENRDSNLATRQRKSQV